MARVGLYSRAPRGGRERLTFIGRGLASLGKSGKKHPAISLLIRAAAPLFSVAMLISRLTVTSSVQFHVLNSDVLMVASGALAVAILQLSSMSGRALNRQGDIVIWDRMFDKGARYDAQEVAANATKAEALDRLVHKYDCADAAALETKIDGNVALRSELAIILGLRVEDENDEFKRKIQEIQTAQPQLAWTGQFAALGLTNTLIPVFRAKFAGLNTIQQTTVSSFLGYAISVEATPTHPSGAELVEKAVLFRSFIELASISDPAKELVRMNLPSIKRFFREKMGLPGVADRITEATLQEANVKVAVLTILSSASQAAADAGNQTISNRILDIKKILELGD